nr:tyrosyl-dna phosphodiesterase 1 [Quercus suber]
MRTEHISLCNIFLARVNLQIGPRLPVSYRFHCAHPSRRHHMVFWDVAHEHYNRSDAIMTGQEQSSSTKDSLHVSKPAVPLSVATRPAPFSLGGLDRRAMEQERLARIQKRQRSISPPGSRRKAPKLTETQIDLPSGARLTTFTSLVDQDQATRKAHAANLVTEELKSADRCTPVSEQRSYNVPSTIPGDVIYPHGIYKKTWAFGHERTGNEVKIEEVLESSTLRIAVLSAFQWDMPWILTKLKTPDKGGRTKCVFIMQAKEQELRDQMLDETKDVRSFLRLCFPPMLGQTHCMHSKLMLLFHPKKLRIVIPTANLLDFDWGETGVMENSVFMIDLPRLADGQKTGLQDLPDFGKELLYFLDKQSLDDDVRTGLTNFDFSTTKDMRFIHTVGGVSYKVECQRTGLCGLGKAVRELGTKSTDLEIDFAASSIGSLTDEYLKSFQAAAKGDDMVLRATKAETQAKTDFFKPAAQRKLQAPLKLMSESFRIYFPTSETVRTSTATAAGTICISRKYWESGKFPSNCFRDYRSVRKGLLSHNKILYARGRRKDTASGAVKNVAWAYIGSANMSASAWGNLSYDRNRKEWKIICRNWECGVLLPVPDARLTPKKERKSVEAAKKDPADESETESETSETESEAGDEDDKIVGMDVFQGIVDPPFEIPGQLYGGREPWFFLERSGNQGT